MENNIVKVSLWGQTVGELYWDEKRKQACFSYSSDFVSKGLDVAPFTASIHNPLLAKGAVYLGNKTGIYKGLPEFLADSLPDNWGERVIKHWSDHYGNKVRLTPVDALSLVGHRSIGAFEFEPYMEKWDGTTDIMLPELYRLAGKIMDESKFPEGEDSLIHLQKLFRVGTTAGGKHPKAIIAINHQTGEIKSGQGILPAEYKYYILKFNELKEFPTTLLEKTYYDMAVAAGIPMMPSSLMAIDGIPHFLTERFDRKDGEKIHTQTLAALAPQADSYEDLFSVARKLGIPNEELTDLYRQTVFNILGDNLDDHNKNFSFIMYKDGAWHASPAYDMCFTYDITGIGFANSHELTLGGKDKGITKEDLLTFGKTNDIRNAAAVIDEISDVLMDFRNYAEANGVSNGYADVIRNKLCQNLNVKFTATSGKSREAADEPELPMFNHIAVRKKKEKYTIMATLNGTRLREKKILQEDYMSFSLGIVSKEKLALKYFREEINLTKSKSKDFLIDIAVKLTCSRCPESSLETNEIEKVHNSLAVFGGIDQRRKILCEVWEEAIKRPDAERVGRWLEDAKDYLDQLAGLSEVQESSQGLKI